MSAQAAPAEPYIFISYASADRARALVVVDALQRTGVSVWIDRQGIEGGANYALEITEAIERCAAFVLLCSAASLASRNVKQEIALAWKFERPYLPLLLEPVTIPKDVAYWLEAAQWVEVFDELADAWMPAVLAALAPHGIAPRPDTEHLSLVGREREQALLRDHLSAMMDSRGSLVLIGGEAGIGKTTLAETLMREAAARGALVLTGRCFDLTETPPYGPWVEMFRRYEPAGGQPPPPPAFVPRGTVGEVASQAALFQQVEEFVLALAGQCPVLLLLDDLHWADPASLDLMRFLARGLAALPLLVLVTYRSDELTRRHALYPLLPMLVREASAARLDLGRLDDAAVRALVTERYGLPEDDAARLATYLQGRAEGNALFLGELLRALEEAGTLRQENGEWRLDPLTQVSVPPLLRQVIDCRIARLDDESRRLLALAAVIGQEVPYLVWASVAEVDEDALLDVIETAAEARLMEEIATGTGARFVHALIREALYEGILPSRRRRLHRRVAEALATSPQPDPDMVAYHFQRADDERALPWLLEAGGRAQAAYAFTTAAQRFETALALMERTDADAGERGWLLLRLARLLRWGEVAKARAFADESLALAGAAADRTLAAYARSQRGMLACFAGDVAYGLPELEAAAAALSALSEAERASFATHAAAIDALFLSPDGRGAVVTWRANVGRYREARELGEQLVAEGVEDGHTGLGDAYAALGMPDEASAMHARAHDAFLRAGHHFLASRASSRELESVALPYRAEDIAGRQLLATQVQSEHERASDSIPVAFPSRFRHVPLLLLEGRWDEAAALAEVVGAEEWGSVGNRATALRHLAWLARSRGDAQRAWWAVQEVLPKGSATDPGTVALFEVATALQRVAAALALDEGTLPTAREWLEAHDRWLAWSAAVLGQSEGQALWAQYQRQSSDAATARDHAEYALAHATEPRQPLALLAAHRLVGELDTETGRFDAADAHFRASLALADACAAPYERALTLLALANLRAATNRTADARALLNDVRAICTPLSAKPTLARADALAARMPNPPTPFPFREGGASRR